MPDTKYKAKDLLGDHIANHLKGTRLASHLTEIRDRFGHNDGELKKLAEMALGGHTHLDPDAKEDIFTAIRDRLRSHSADQMMANKDPSGRSKEYNQRAKDLTYGYNWHRINSKLAVDRVVRDYINSAATQRLKESGKTFRKAKQLWNTSGFADNANLSASLRNGLWKELGRQIESGKSDSLRGHNWDWKDIEDSIERLSRQEEYQEALKEKGQKQLKETRPTVLGKDIKKPVDIADTMNWLAGSNPAYENVAKSRNKWITVGPKVNDNLDVEQYQVDDLVLRYGVLETLGLRAKPKPLPHGPDGVAFKGGPGSAEDPFHVANLERQAVQMNLDNLGLTDSRSSDPVDRKKAAEWTQHYTDALRDHFKTHFNPHGSLDPHTQHYLNTISSLSKDVFTPRKLASGLAPLVKAKATEWGHLDPNSRLPFGEEVAEEQHPTLDVDDAPPTADYSYLNDPLGWAAAKKTVVDDAPLPIVPKAKKSKEMLKQRLMERKGRDQKAFTVLNDLQKGGVNEGNWAQHLKEKIGLSKRSAEAVIRKFHKLTAEQKKATEPLRFAAQLSDVLKGDSDAVVST